MSDFIRVGTVSFAFGALLLLLALVGGGLSIKEVTLSQLNQATRVILAAVGAAFIAIGLWVTFKGQPTSTAPDGTINEGPKPSAVTTSTTIPNAAAATTTTPEPFPSVAERELLEHVSEDLRERCQRDNEPHPNTRASVTCNPTSGASTAWFMVYTKVDDMKKEYYGQIDRANVKQDSGVCEKDQVEETTYEVDKVTVGRYACYREGGRVRMVWFHEKLRILGMASRDDGNAPRLKSWWSHAGPF
jgi:hypothetical protein